MNYKRLDPLDQCQLSIKNLVHWGWQTHKFKYWIPPSMRSIHSTICCITWKIFKKCILSVFSWTCECSYCKLSQRTQNTTEFVTFKHTNHTLSNKILIPTSKGTHPHAYNVIADTISLQTHNRTGKNKEMNFLVKHIHQCLTEVWCHVNDWNSKQ